MAKTAELIKQKIDLLSQIVIKGDISGLNDQQRAEYYLQVCQSLGLNPITKPFDIMVLQGKTVLYCNKEGSLQLSKINGISIVDINQTFVNDLCITKVKVQDKTGRFDMSTGAVNISGLRGDALANAIMKSETKGKRRAILSISGLGALDETEVEIIPHEYVPFQPSENNYSGKDTKTTKRIDDSIDGSQNKGIVETGKLINQTAKLATDQIAKEVTEEWTTFENIKATYENHYGKYPKGSLYNALSALGDSQILEICGIIAKEVAQAKKDFEDSKKEPENAE